MGIGWLSTGDPPSWNSGCVGQSLDTSHGKARGTGWGEGKQERALGVPVTGRRSGKWAKELGGREGGLGYHGVRNVCVQRVGVDSGLGG